MSKSDLHADGKSEVVPEIKAVILYELSGFKGHVAAPFGVFPNKTQADWFRKIKWPEGRAWGSNIKEETFVSVKDRISAEILEIFIQSKIEALKEAERVCKADDFIKDMEIKDPFSAGTYKLFLKLLDDIVEVVLQDVLDFISKSTEYNNLHTVTLMRKEDDIAKEALRLKKWSEETKTKHKERFNKILDERFKEMEEKQQ
jgi:hypothetical protein